MRGLITGLLLVVGLLLVPFATVGIWMQRQILPTDAFTDLASEVVAHPDVRDALADRFLDELENQEPRLAVGRLVLQPAVRQALTTPQFEQIFRAAVSDMHGQLKRGDEQLSLDLDALLPVVRNLVAEVDSGLAQQIPTSAGLPAITVVRKSDVPQLWFGVEVTREASWVFPVLMVVALAGAVVIASKRALVLITAGFGVALMCLTVGLALRTGRDALSDFVGSVVDVRAFNAGYDIVTDSLVSQTLLLGLVGVIAAAAGVVWLLVGRSSTQRPTTWA